MRKYINTICGNSFGLDQTPKLMSSHKNQEQPVSNLSHGFDKIMTPSVLVSVSSAKQAWFLPLLLAR